MTPPLPPRTEPRIAATDAVPDLAAPSGLDPGNRRTSVPKRATRRIPLVGLILLMLLVAGTVFFYLWRKDVAHQSPVAVPAATQPAQVTAAEPAIRHPIEDVQGTAPAIAEVKPLPALMTSDTTMQNALADLFGPASLGKIFYDDAIIHRFVATIDNLPRKSVPASNLPVKPPGGVFVVTSRAGDVSIGADNAARYAPYVRLADAADAKSLVAAYVHFYPLMQQDYRDLGYPKGYFNDRVIDAIDDLLAAPAPDDSARLAQPKVLYQYADPELEERSAGQKIMMRMGAENASKIKAKLREIRALLTASRVAAPAAPKQAQ